MLSGTLLPRLMILSLTACTVTPNDGAICVGTEASRKALAGALPTDGGPQARCAGLLVLDQMRAGCGP
ncbi:MAG TPA: hypothetical protein PKA35_06560 [Paracoccus solventivorans]|uniref:hypothetical protein n=1 Tax=Paracoccus solventivorans TaxID=53463 RepID=UPI002CEC7AAA|nr:hypothetical protein [Paracoccus solventivorans]HMM08765.1 hypothetical protein [Paracoccus solventivorans]